MMSIFMLYVQRFNCRPSKNDLHQFILKPLPPTRPLEMMPDIKVVKIDSKIIISLHRSKSVKLIISLKNSCHHLPVMYDVIYGRTL
jgi:hypothetical protein